MNDMLESQTIRTKRLALKNLQQACSIYEKTERQKGKPLTYLKKTDKFLGRLTHNIRVNRFSQYFTQNLLMNNIFRKKYHFTIKSTNQIDEERLIKWQGIRFNQKILAIIYIIQIMFVLVTLFLSGFVAFFQGFRILDYHKQTSILTMNLFAIVFSLCKIGTSIVTKKIKEGITLVYISDIFYDYVTSLVIFIDMAYLIMLIWLIIEGNDSFLFGVILFILCLVKMISCFPNLSVFQTTFIKGFRNENYWKLVKTIIFNIGFAHFLASMLLAMASASDTENWLIVHELNDKEWWIQYMWAYYWATTIMMTIGFGDITATNHNEAMVLAFLEFFSCIVLAYNVSQIGSVVSALRSAGSEYQKKISIFKRMAQQDEIDIELKTKIEGYLKEQREINETYEFHEQSVLLNSIPDNLKKQYINQSNKKFFTYIPFFKNIRKATLMKFTDHFSGRVYYPGEFLLTLHEDHENILILKQGRVGLTYKKQGSKLNGTPVQSLEIEEKTLHIENSIFQKKAVPIILNTNFLNRTTKNNYEIIAESYSFVYSITYERFLFSIKESDVDSSYYFSILHRTSFSKNQWLQIECQKCNQEIQISDELDLEKSPQFNSYFTTVDIEALKHQKRKEYHTKFQCPKLHFCPLKGIVVLKSIKSKGSPQKANLNFKRKKQRQKHSYFLKSVFKPFEDRINIRAKKRLQAMIVKDYLESIHNSKVQQRIKTHGNFTLESIEQVQILQKLIKKSLHEVIRGYQEGYWDLEIDVMNNYLSYFPNNNASNFDHTALENSENNDKIIESKKRKDNGKLQIGEIKQFQANLQKKRNHGYETVPNKLKTNKIQISEGNEQGKRHYFKKILMSDKPLSNSFYSPKNSSNNQQTEILQDNISEDDISQRDHSTTGIRPNEKYNLMKRKSSN